MREEDEGMNKGEIAQHTQASCMSCCPFHMFGAGWVEEGEGGGEGQGQGHLGHEQEKDSATCTAVHIVPFLLCTQSWASKGGQGQGQEGPETRMR